MEVFTLEHLPEQTEIETKMQYSLLGGNKDGGIYTRVSTWRDRVRDKNAIFSTWREQRWRYLLENLHEETELETKMQYSLPGENKDGGIY